MLRCGFKVSPSDARSGLAEARAGVLEGGPTGLLGERGTVSPAGDLDFSRSSVVGATVFGYSLAGCKFFAMSHSVIMAGGRRSQP